MAARKRKPGKPRRKPVKLGFIIDVKLPITGHTRKADISILNAEGQMAATDHADVADSRERTRLAKKLVKDLQKGTLDQWEKALQQAHLKAIEEQTAIASQGSSGTVEENKKASQADILVEVSQSTELFHTPGGHDSEGYATVTINGHKETWAINSKGFRRWLGRQFFEQVEKAPGSQAIQDALNVIAANAVYDGEEKEIAIRLAEFEGAIWFDLANDKWQAVRISTSGWQVVDDCPVKFVRRRGMLPLPLPVRGGRIDEFRELVNLPDDDAWRLNISFLVASLRPGRPFPILAVNGEHGSAKSTLCRMNRALIDPNVAPLRRPPKEDRDLMIAAANGWIVGFDNLSGLSPSLADSICTLATGGGFGTRELYSDSDEKLFDAMRPVILNGIEDLATRSDVLDRSLNITLPEIPAHRRRDEDELWRTFEQIRPRILGALLDAVSMALRNLSSVNLPQKPRMADFACWIVAAEPALGWPPGAFLASYMHNRGASNSSALESSIIAPPIISLTETKGTWHGTASDLLAELEAHFTDEKTRKRKEWPCSPRKLSGDLRRLAPNLRQAGINVSFGKHTKVGTPITLEPTGKSPSPSSLLSPASENGRIQGDDVSQSSGETVTSPPPGFQ